MYPLDLTGCGYYRLIWPAEELIRQGHDITIVKPTGREQSFVGAVDNDTDELTDARVPDDADIVVLQRVTHRHIASAVSILRKKGITVIVDVDDDLSNIHQKHPAWITLHPHKDPRRAHKNLMYHNWHNTAKACQDASLVTTSSDALLQRYARHGRGHILRNYVPQSFIDLPRKDSKIIGWGGAVVSHPDDLQVTGRMVQQLVDSGMHFRIVGPIGGVQENLQLKEEPDHTGPVDISEWPHKLSELGVGIAPLSDTVFNKAKSWLKPLEYASVGVVPVMSPRAEYWQLQRLGIGIIAGRPREWLKHISQLINDDNYRIEQSLKMREIAAGLTIPLHAWRWSEAWIEAYEKEH